MLVNNKKTDVIRGITLVNTTVGSMTVEMSCFVLQSTLHHLIIGRPSSKVIHESLYFDHDVSTFWYAVDVA